MTQRKNPKEFKVEYCHSQTGKRSVAISIAPENQAKVIRMIEELSEKSARISEIAKLSSSMKSVPTYQVSRSR